MRQQDEIICELQKKAGVGNEDGHARDMHQQAHYSHHSTHIRTIEGKGANESDMQGCDFHAPYLRQGVWSR